MSLTDTPKAPALGQFKRMPLREVWVSEAGSFTPWLAEEANLTILAETLGLPEMTLLQTEHPVGPYRADIVCKVLEDERLILIENQIERSDHIHLGQILTYASGLNAAIVVWITSQFTEEHRSVIDWLNHITAEEFYFFGVEIEVWRIDDSRPAPRFNIVAEPNDWSRAVRGSVREAKREPPDPVITAYWTALEEEMRSRNLALQPRDQLPRSGLYTLTLDSPRRVYLSAYRETSRRRIGVYIALYELQGMGVYRRWEAERAQIDKEIGATLDWREVKEGRAYHIAIRRENTDALDQSDWANQVEWMCNWLDRFHKVFAPRVAALPAVEELIAAAEDLMSNDSKQQISEDNRLQQ